MEELLARLSDMPARVWETLSAMAPFLLFGFLAAGVLSVLISAETVERHLGGRGRFWPAFKAAAFGVPLPLCSCSVIPVSASLRRHGAGRSATVSFLLSAPQTGVDSVLATYSMLGPVFAVFRPLVALASGLLGGTLAGLAGPSESAEGAAPPPIRCEGECCSTDGPSWPVKALGYGLVTLPRDLWRALAVGIAVAGLIAALIPQDYFAERLAGGGIGMSVLAMLAMMVVGLPIYVCATASVPVAASLIHAGLSPGAALVFLMTGPATNAATVATIWRTMGRRTTVIYMATVAASALAAGLALDGFFSLMGLTARDTVMAHAGHGLLPGWAATASALALLGLLACAALSGLTRERSSLDEGPGVTTLSVSGMTCGHCAETVTRALEGLAGVEEVRVDLASGKVMVRGRGLDPAALSKEVAEAGYEVTGHESPAGRTGQESGRKEGEDRHGAQGHAD